MLVEDIIGQKPRLQVLKVTSSAADFHMLVSETGEHRFPVVDEWNRVIGIVSLKDVSEPERRSKY